ncbi:hypothetical protein ASD64_06600 [Mesorhizobium sp. Root157]|uniref:hypothetical protein n=1 Tax=Mesorhizobium sp. Root157 TaxID=1736477 RepID=UPI0006FAFE74|nr:hypothetical protein [Mesorhizobium sp. Root157]KQZ87109.1 hypothetical protein ASD64_06600 [Mesorhizobium sp. Root157]
MTNRTTQTVVSFSSAFVLPGLGEQPAGDYRIDHDEVTIEGLSRLAWQRVGTFIRLPSIGTDSPIQQMVPVDPAALNAALEQDQNPS